MVDQNYFDVSAPFICNSEPEGHVSARYKFISTIDVLQQLQVMGWGPLGVYSKVRGTPTRFSKHLVIMSPQWDKPRGDLGVLPYLYVVNSHNRTSPFRIYAGFALAGKDGMKFTVSSQEVHYQKIRHIGQAPDHVLETCQKTVQVFPEVIANIDAMRKVQLSWPEICEFTQSAAFFRWGRIMPGIGVNMAARFSSDAGADLFSVYCETQSLVINGGFVIPTKGAKRAMVVARKIKSYMRDILIGQLCWSLAVDTLKRKTDVPNVG